MAETTLHPSVQQRREQQARSNAPQSLTNIDINSLTYQYLTRPTRIWPLHGENCGGVYQNYLHHSFKQHQVRSYCTRGGKRVGIDCKLSSPQVKSRVPDNNNDKEFQLKLPYLNRSAIIQSDHMEQYSEATNRAAKSVSDKNLSLLLIASILFLSHNALPCSSFDSSEFDHDSDIVDYDHLIVALQLLIASIMDANRLTFEQPSVAIPQPSYVNSNYNGPRSIWYRQLRSYDVHENDDIPQTGLMPAPAGSLSRDESADTGPTVANSWTSILTNPFSGGSVVNTNTGGNDEFDKHIKAILVPRVSGTPGNVQVRQYIVDNLESNDYHVELDEFTASTPIGNVKFANIIASSNPKACRQLVLACHYDSKMMDGFLGATDSAVPCAMLLRISETSGKSYRPSNGGGEDDNRDSLGLKFIFFDGEEAYKQWTSTDSLYGSRHLAMKWAKQAAPAHCNLGVGKTELDRIELFVLLDLIGASDTSFVMYGNRFKSHFESMQSYERAHLLKSGLSQGSIRRNMAFRTRTVPLDFVEDDHVPFKKRGVPILLLLAHPFPKVWHTISDNYQAIDFAKTRRILHVMEEFVVNYPGKKAQ